MVIYLDFFTIRTYFYKIIKTPLLEPQFYETLAEQYKKPEPVQMMTMKCYICSNLPNKRCEEHVV